MSAPIKKVLVLGASGSVGPSIVTALLNAEFNVSVLTRQSSKSTFSEGVAVIRTDYTESSLLLAFKGQDAVVSAIATFSTYLQTSIISSAAKAGVKRFIPSEYGVDTSGSTLQDFLPFALPKQNAVQCLKTYEGEGMSWTAVIVGAFFDWVFEHPGLMGWNVPARKATIFDGGDVEYEATNVAQIGRAVAACLSAEHSEKTKNKYVYVNSFTLKQNKVLQTLETLTGENFEVEHASAKELAGFGLDKAKAGGKISAGGGEYVGGSVEVITAAIYGNGGLNNFSKTQGLWNDRLGLPVDDFDETMIGIMKTRSD